MLNEVMSIRMYIMNAPPGVRILVGISAAMLFGYVLFILGNPLLDPRLSDIKWYLCLLVELIVFTSILWALGVGGTKAKKR
ncbi:MAG: hypothetical protein QMC78_01780 [Methanocellales archaeon]|nr:hypothetical protein [Methanocellales archaeon]